jgi:hypothetical protein
MWCNGSTNVFGAFSFGSSPDITTKNNNMRKGWDRIKSLGNWIDSNIAEEYILILAYLLTIGISLVIEVFTNK